MQDRAVVLHTCSRVDTNLGAVAMLHARSAVDDSENFVGAGLYLDRLGDCVELGHAQAVAAVEPPYMDRTVIPKRRASASKSKSCPETSVESVIAPGQ